MDSENEKLIEVDTVYKDLFNLFEKIFRSHYLHLNDSFDNNVWFLAKDPEFYSNKLNNSTTPNTTINPENYNLMHQILENTSINGCDFKKLKVNVTNFIKILIIELMKIHKQSLKINQKIASFNIDENVNVIEEKIFKLVDSEYNKIESILKINLVKIENLPEGDYDCSLFVKKSKKNRLVDGGLVDNEVFISSIPNIKIIRRINEFKDGKDYSFQKIKIETVEINYNEFKPNEEILKIFSGTNLNSFQLECKNKTNNTIYKTKKEETIELYLKLIDFFCDLTKVSNECILSWV